MYFVSRRSGFGLILTGSTVLTGNRPGKRPKPSVRRVKPLNPPQPSKNAPLLDKRLLFGQKDDLEVIPGLD